MGGPKSLSLASEHSSFFGNTRCLSICARSEKKKQGDLGRSRIRDDDGNHREVATLRTATEGTTDIFVRERERISTNYDHSIPSRIYKMNTT